MYPYEVNETEVSHQFFNEMNAYSITF